MPLKKLTLCHILHEAEVLGKYMEGKIKIKIMYQAMDLLIPQRMEINR